MKVRTAQIAAEISKVLEKIWANLSAKFLFKILEKKPENKKPKSGKNTVSFKSIFSEIFFGGNFVGAI